MPKFGERSQRELATLHPNLIMVLEEVIKHIDFSVLKGRRNKEAQDEAYQTGRSKARWPDSAHNTPIRNPKKAKRDWKEDPNGLSRAVDLAPWPIDWNDLTQFAFLAGQVVATARRLGVRIRWGGDWDADGQGNWRDPDGGYFNDLVHFELVDS